MEATDQLLLGALLRLPYQAVASSILRGLAAEGYGDVRLSHIPVIQYLYTRPDGTTITELAQRGRITKQSMGSLVDYLEERGYIERARHPADGRAQIVRLARRGWDLARTMRANVRRIERELEGRLGKRRIKTLKQLLRGLIAALSA